MKRQPVPSMFLGELCWVMAGAQLCVNTRLVAARARRDTRWCWHPLPWHRPVSIRTLEKRFIEISGICPQLCFCQGPANGLPSLGCPFVSLTDAHAVRINHLLSSISLPSKNSEPESRARTAWYCTRNQKSINNSALQVAVWQEFVVLMG